MKIIPSQIAIDIRLEKVTVIQGATQIAWFLYDPAAPLTFIDALRSTADHLEHKIYRDQQDEARSLPE